MRQVFGRGFFVGGALASVMTHLQGTPAVGKAQGEIGRQPAAVDDRPGHVAIPIPDGKLTFDKLSSVFASGNQTRDDQPNHIRVVQRVPPELAELWVHMCPAQVYAATPAGDDGLANVQLAPSNCVQCGAISAKGGRLTPPEGGSGPEYTLT